MQLILLYLNSILHLFIIKEISRKSRNISRNINDLLSLRNLSLILIGL